MTQCDHCQAEASVIVPGSEPVHELFLLARGERQRAWCLDCARQAGWPWLRSEASKHAQITLLRQVDVERCPFRIMKPEHYRLDGVCRCRDREHTSMVAWGYTWDDETYRWTEQRD